MNVDLIVRNLPDRPPRPEPSDRREEDRSRTTTPELNVRNLPARPEGASAIADRKAARVRSDTMRDESLPEFSELLALIAAARNALTPVVSVPEPRDGASALDTILEALAMGSAKTAGVAALRQTSSSVRAVSDMDVRIDGQIGSSVDSSVIDATSSDVNDALNVIVARSRSRTRSRTRDTGAHAHLNEVLSRIVAGPGTSPDQLQARGDHEAAGVRAALDALLANAGTPLGLRLSGATDLASLTADATAAAAALTSALTVSSADVTTPVRAVDGLAPELRAKLERVTERMKQEYGHDVDVVETVRSQARQDFLHEQGRTRAGAVVTWTRESAHTRGEAVDVTVDGKWNNADGFARLQRIAGEEGLRTLGVRDPGHLELASDRQFGVNNSAADNTTLRDRPLPRALPTSTPNATPSAVPSASAGVARVAGVADVAGVAGVATTGGPGVRSVNNTGEAERSTSASTMVSAIPGESNGPAGRHGLGNAFGRGERDDRGRPFNEGRRLGNADRGAVDVAAAPAFGTPSANMSTAAPRAVDSTASAAGINSAARVADLQDARDATPAGSVSRMTLRIDTGDGGQDQITVDLRGAQVGAQIHTDTGNAEQLRLRTAELQDALGRHGLESDSVRISGVPRSDVADVARLVGGERDGLRLGAAQQGSAGDHAASHGQRERFASGREWNRPDPSRQAREERESARQGAGQSGQRNTSSNTSSNTSNGSAR